VGPGGPRAYLGCEGGGHDLAGHVSRGRRPAGERGGAAAPGAVYSPAVTPEPAAGGGRARRDLGESLIVAYKWIKAVAEVGLAAAVVFAASRGELDAVRALALHLEHGVAGRWSVLVGRALARLVSDRGVHLVELGLALDGVVSAVEGFTLWRGYWWGRWLVVAATGSPLPVELVEVARRPTALRIAATLLNAAVVLYLARRIARRRREAVPQGAARAQTPPMATRHGNKGEKSGRTTPHGTGRRIAGEPVPRQDKAEPESGAMRDPLPNEYQTERSDVPGVRKKIT
jgi:uncharacterized membrane protein (DUF2068 family)